MADFIEINLRGIGDFRALLKRLPPEIREKHVRPAITEGAAIAADAVAFAAPVRTRHPMAYRKGQPAPLPGRLRRLPQPVARTGKDTYQKASVMYPTEGAGNDPLNAFYWRFVERGTRYITARKYIDRAVESVFDQVVDVVISNVRRGIRSEVSKASAR